MKNTAFVWVLVSGILSFSACQSKEAAQEQQEVHAAQEHTAASDSAHTKASAQQLAYICPMECEGSASNTPGKCPVCGMELVKNTNASSTQDSIAQ